MSFHFLFRKLENMFGCVFSIGFHFLVFVISNNTIFDIFEHPHPSTLHTQPQPHIHIHLTTHPHPTHPPHPPTHTHNPQPTTPTPTHTHFKFGPHFKFCYKYSPNFFILQICHKIVFYFYFLFLLLFSNLLFYMF